MRTNAKDVYDLLVVAAYPANPYEYDDQNQKDVIDAFVATANLDSRLSVSHSLSDPVLRGHGIRWTSKFQTGGTLHFVLIFVLKVSAQQKT